MSRRIVVAGAGVLGAAIAWRLAGAGHRVTLVDPTPGGRASPGSFAWLNASFAEDPAYNRLRHQSLELWAGLAAHGAPVRFPGAILWEQEHFDLDAILASHQALGRPAAMLDRAGIAAREPAVAAPPARALYAAGDGLGDPVAITGWFLDRARAAGAELGAGARVERVETRGGAVAGVATTAGRIAADAVVLAVGIALPELLGPLGLGIAMLNEPGLLARTTPAAPLIRAMLATPQVHVWQGADGGFLLGADFGGSGDVERPEAEAAAVLAELKRVLPGAAGCEIARVTVRERPMPADGRPAIGRVGPDGLYVVSTHSGMTLAPIIAEAVAHEIGDRTEDPRLAPWRPGRPALAPSAVGLGGDARR